MLRIWRRLRRTSPGARSSHTTRRTWAAAGTALLANGSEVVEIDHDTMIGAYLVDPARRTYVIEELAADAGIAVRSGEAPEAARPTTLSFRWARNPRRRATRRSRRVSPGSLPSASASSSPSSGSSGSMREVELPLVEVLVAMEREGLKLDTERLAAIGEGMEARIDELEAEIYEAAGREFTIGSPSQLGEVLFVELGLTRKRRGKTGYSTDARVLSQIRDENPIVPGGRAVARAHEAQEHLSRLAARPDRPRDGPNPHDLQPGDGRHRAPLVDEPEPSEHPDPLRSRAARSGAASSPTRAISCSRATTTRWSFASSHTWRTRRSCARSSRRTRMSIRRRRRASSARIPTRSRPPSARRRRWSTTGSPTA